MLSSFRISINGTIPILDNVLALASNFIQIEFKMWKSYENVSVKWLWQIKVLSILGHYTISEISDVVLKY